MTYESKTGKVIDFMEQMKLLNLTYIDNEDCEADIDSTRDLREAFSSFKQGRELFSDQPCLKISIKLNKKFLEAPSAADH